MRRRYGRELREELAGIARIGGPLCLMEFLARLAAHAGTVVRARSLAVVDEAMGARTRVFRAGDVSLRVRGAFGGAREIYGRNVYEAVPGFDVRKGDVVVDLGANVGLFTILAACRGARVLAVEAQSRFVDEIQRHAQLNGCADRVSVEVALLGAGTGFFADPARLRGGSHYGTPPPPLTRAELLGRHRIERVDLLKVDVEGAEFGIFAGDRGWLACVGRIVMEVHCEFGDPGLLARRLIYDGFAVTFVDNRGVVVPGITEGSGYLFALRRP